MFPFSEKIQLGKDLFIPASIAHDQIEKLLTKDRVEKIHRVVDNRTFNVVAVLENIYDRGNASAVMRSAEALGISYVHSIEPGEKFKESQRTTAGADKWVEIKRWKSSAECIRELRMQKKQIIVTHLDATSIPISKVDFTKPTALVLGNEKDGVSNEMIEAADVRVILPMVGFVQSYNISVAGALAFYQIYMDRIQRQGFHGDLTDQEKMILRTCYFMRTQPSSEDILKEFLQRKL